MTDRLAALTICLLLLLLPTACGPGDDGPAAGGGDELTTLFAKYREAMRAGDLEALRAVLTAEKAEELNAPEVRQMIPLLQAMVPQQEVIGEIKVEGDRATLALTCDSDDEPGLGTVHFVREGGAWKIEKESWHFGETSGGPDVVVQPDTEPIEKVPPPEGEWNLDLEASAIPDRPASGRIKGRDFHVLEAELQQGSILTLRNGPLFRSDAEFTVFLFLRGEEKAVAGRSFAVGPKQDFDAPAGAHVHLQYPEPEESGPGMDSVTDGFALKLEFGELEDGKLPGRIYVCYPDDERSYVAGSFTAIVK